MLQVFIAIRAYSLFLSLSFFFAFLPLSPRTLPFLSRRGLVLSKVTFTALPCIASAMSAITTAAVFAIVPFHAQILSTERERVCVCVCVCEEEEERSEREKTGQMDFF